MSRSEVEHHILTELRVIVAATAQLVYGGESVYHSADPTFDTWKRTVCLQVVQNVCVMSCSIPYMKPFYMGLQSGLIRTDDLRRTGRSTSDYTQMSKDGRLVSRSDHGRVTNPQSRSGSTHTDGSHIPA